MNVCEIKNLYMFYLIFLLTRFAQCETRYFTNCIGMPHPEVLEGSDETVKGHDKFPVVWSSEGKYLAQVLGDALVKGLTEVSQQRPPDPVIYLANFLRSYGSQGGTKPVDQSEDDFTEGEGTTSNNENAESSKITEESKSEEMPEAASSEKQDHLALPNKDDSREEEHMETETTNKEGEEDMETENGKEVEEHQQGEAMSEVDDEEMLQRLEDTVDPDDADDEEDSITPVEEDQKIQNGTRDDRGQSVLHFAASRPGGASTILAFLQNPTVNLAWRDERLRTARDVAESLNRMDNLQAIDSWVIGLVSSGNVKALNQLVVDGYDHVLDVQDKNGQHVVEVADHHNQKNVALFLRKVPSFLEQVAKLHRSIRDGKVQEVKKIVESNKEDGKILIALNPYGRMALHVAVLMEEQVIVQMLADAVGPVGLKRGDHLERTPLHYAMGVEHVEKITRILVKAGAKRVVKDLRGRQPSYYFINREEISMLQKQEHEIKTSK